MKASVLAIILISFILLISSCFFIIALITHSHDVDSDYVLDEQHKRDIVDISLNDPYVLDDIRLWNSHGIIYKVGNVSMSEYAEGCGNTVDRVLPCVELIAGKEDGNELRQYSFVDPVDRRVTYIGYINTIQYINTYNKTIKNTGFKKGVNITESQRDAAIQIALDDWSVRRHIDNNNYEIRGIRLWYQDDGPIGQCISVYPEVEILVSGVPEYSLYVGIDVKNKRVLYAKPAGQLVHPPPG